MKNYSSFYKGKEIALATMHHKELYLSSSCKKILGASLYPLNETINTDLLGTFSSEIERKGSQKETALKKCHMGLELSGLLLSLASEGSFGPHPHIPFLSTSLETLVFVDKINQIEIFQSKRFTTTNYAQITCSNACDITEFLKRCKFPSHGLIIRPNIWDDKTILFKGIQDILDLKKHLSFCCSASLDGKAHIETDMRAHMNPTRGFTICKLGILLFRRLTRLCPSCSSPGWDRTDIKKGKPCLLCNYPSALPVSYVWSCSKCPHTEEQPIKNESAFAPPEYCDMCNP